MAGCLILQVCFVLFLPCWLASIMREFEYLLIREFEYLLIREQHIQAHMQV